MKLVKKLTTKHVYGGPKEVLKLFPEGAKDGQRVEIYRVLGMADKVRRDEGTFGAFAELVGDFLAVTPDGTQYQSGKCFLPDGAAHDATVNAVENADGNAVEFAFKFDAVRDSASNTGYTYECETLTKPVISNRMQALMEQAGVSAGAISDQSEGSAKKASAKK